jgi:hypothetical protein
LQTAQIADPDDWSPLGVVNRSEEVRGHILTEDYFLLFTTVKGKEAASVRICVDLVVPVLKRHFHTACKPNL